ncbi:rab proteins geranylgeranyltransferase component A 1 [Nilaparvata lugens]|uniref:rab proteins geranylgeranyltransferase component A 1 n=1 Tax=Nilaparvata lugens TaxID=108931 RepID=UPI00193D1C38|nr:rab proteins geranylgeranyltransferase component A 1 [Nilaparvata lugens]
MADDDLLPTEYDVIVVGTGMAESIVAAAVSRIGKKVLHMDGNEYYGGMWAAFNFDGMQKWIAECKKEDVEEAAPLPPPDIQLQEGESIVPVGNQIKTVLNIAEKWYIAEELGERQLKDTKDMQTGTSESGGGESGVEGEGPKDGGSEGGKAASESKHWSQNKLKSSYRKFNLDLAPKLLFARGSLVELLISSNIARYAEFRSVTRVLTYLGDRLEPVPCSRADVFNTKNVSVVEKRMLMKLLTLCVENPPDTNTEFQDFQDKPFVEYLKSKKLTPNLIHYVLYAIAMSSEQTPCMEGVERTQRFLNSLGRYGNTPFLWPMYGSGELPQCFCRLCAVFGGVYYLKRATHGVIVAASDGGKCTGIVSSQQRLSTQHLVMGLTSAPKQFLKAAPTQGLSRGIFLIDRSILPAEKETLTLLQFPPCEGSPEPITVVEVGPSTNACPQGLFVVHMTCKQQKSAEEDLAVAVSKLFHLEYCDGTVDRIDTDTQATQTAKTEPCEGSEEADGASQDTARHKPQLLWSLYFNCPETNSCQLSADVPANVHLCCSGPDLDLDFEYAVKQAKEIFTKMYPDSEFLPRAPDPEEIVLEDDEAPGPAFKAESEDINEENK